MSSGSIHKLYCGIYSTFKCSFDEIVWGGKSSPRPTPQQSWLLSCGVWREHAGLLSRPCRKRRPSSCEVRGVSWFFWSCGASVGFLTRYDRELREPLVWCQGSQVSIRVARGRTSLLSSHGSGIRAQRNEKGRSRSFSGHCIKPRVPLTCACDLRELLRVPLRSQGYCAVWRVLSRLLCIWWNVRGTHLELKQEPQCSSPFLTQIARSLHVGTGESGLVFSGGWDSSCLSSCSRGDRPLVELCV